MTSPAALSDADVADRLLGHLRARMGAPALAYAEAPVRITGGFETSIFGFRLADPPATLAGPLILRALRPMRDPRQIRLEAAIQNALVSQGYPAPRALLMESDPSIVGGAFMVMQRADGTPLARGFDGLVSGAGGMRVLRLLSDVPRMVERMTEAWADAQARLHAVPVGPVMEELRAAGLSPEAFTFDGRLAMLGQAIADANLDALKPALDWLRANRPPQPATLSVCHGDLHPLNILASDGEVTAVLDWGNVALGDPALDVGSTIAGISTTPFDVPAGLRLLVRSMLRYALWRYQRAYRRRRAVDPASVRYYQVFRSLNHLTGALRTERQGGMPAGAHHLPAARQLLVAHIRQLSGGAVNVVA